MCATALCSISSHQGTVAVGLHRGISVGPSIVTLSLSLSNCFSSLSLSPSLSLLLSLSLPLSLSPSLSSLQPFPHSWGNPNVRKSCACFSGDMQTSNKQLNLRKSGFPRKAQGSAEERFCGSKTYRKRKQSKENRAGASFHIALSRCTWGP